MPVEKLDLFIAYQIVILAFFEPISASSPKMKIIPTPGSRCGLLCTLICIIGSILNSFLGL